MIRFAVVLISVMSLSACAVYHESHRPNGVPHQNGDFCPPGQAKKGRC